MPTDPSRPTAAAIVGARLLDLVAVMDRLRSPGGCPWDARQTHASLVEYLIEEAYEAVEAIESGDRPAMREELGDLLLQVVFHARIAAEDADDPWTIDDVADAITTKLIARHPHVFDRSDGEADTEAGGDVASQASEAAWHARKLREKGRASVTDGIPSALPALVFAGKVIARSAALGPNLPVLPAADVAATVLADVVDDAQFGDVLVALVAAGRERGFDAESAVRAASRRRVAVIRSVEGQG